MRGPDTRQPPLPSSQPAVTRGMARQGCTGCFRQMRGRVILVAALLVLVTCALWALSPVFHAPLLVFVNPVPYFRQYTFVVHRGQTHISALAWSPDGKRIASASSEQNTIQVGNAASGRTLFSYQAPRGKLSPLAWSPDGTRLALADLAHSLVVLEGTSGKTDFAVAGTGGELSVAWSPDGRQIAAVTQAFDVRVWDAASGQAQATLHDGTAQAVARSPNGKELASASQDGNVRVWELAAERPSRVGRARLA
jgi:WD40 repeat protein